MNYNKNNNNNINFGSIVSLAILSVIASTLLYIGAVALAIVIGIGLFYFFGTPFYVLFNTIKKGIDSFHLSKLVSRREKVYEKYKDQEEMIRQQSE